MTKIRKSKLRKIIRNKWVVRTAIVLVGLFVIFGIFILGYQFGVNRERTKGPSTTTVTDTSVRTSAVGSVEKVSDSSIEVRPRSGEVKKFVIDGSTEVTGTDGKKTDQSAIEKDARVIVSGKAGSDGTVVAQRIRLI